MWKNTFLYSIVGNYLRLHSLALLGPKRRGGGGGKDTPIISTFFWFSVSHFVKKKTIGNSFENTCLNYWSKDKKITRESLESESSKSPPPQDYWTSGLLCIVLHNLHSPTLPKPNAATCYSILYIFWGLFTLHNSYPSCFIGQFKVVN